MNTCSLSKQVVQFFPKELFTVSTLISILRQPIVYLLKIIPYIRETPEGIKMHVCICVYVCLCIFICLEHFHVSFRDLHPPNSSSRLLITKILRSLVSCRYFSLSLPVFSFAPCCSSQPLVIIGLH